MTTTPARALALLGVAFGLALGCSVERKHEDIQYEYSYEVNDCPTGSHSFDSKAEYCEALKDEELNKGCAPDVRMKTWDDECS